MSQCLITSTRQGDRVPVILPVVTKSTSSPI
jgi:hypothetical protein